MFPLRDCPFCGGKAALKDIPHTGYVRLDCKHSDQCLIRHVLMPVVQWPKMDDIIRDWNGTDYELMKAREDDLK